MIHYISGDLFEKNVEAMVNAVNCVGVMGKGIALQFKNKYPDNFKAYKKMCDKKLLIPGKSFVYEYGSIFERKAIINFPTKLHWRSKSKMEYIIKGLDDLKKIIEEYRFKSVSIPPIGCGNGGLEWNDVKKYIDSKLGEIDADIYVFIPKEKFKITMNNKRAALLYIIDKYKAYDYELGNEEIQRLAYLLQCRGCNLRLTYKWTTNGPYSDNLNKTINDINGKYLVMINESNKIADIKIKEEAIAEMQSVIKRLSINEKNIIDEVASIIEGFENPYSLQLIANIYWIRKENNLSDYNEELIINCFEKNNIKYDNAEHIKIICRHMNKYILSNAV